jgi:histidyl-tRNA synthetase
VGFAAGVERILIALEAAKTPAPAPVAPDFYAVAATDDARAPLFKIVQQLRAAGLSGDLDFEARSIKAQFRSANKSGARFAIVVGGEELAKQVVKVKNMADGVEQVVPLSEAAALLAKGRTS